MARIFQYFKICLMVLAMSLVAVQARTLEETVKEQYDFDPGGRVVVKNVNGRVAINGWNRQQVNLVAQKRVEARDREAAERLMERLKIEIDRQTQEIYIRTRTPRKSGSWFERSTSASVSYTIDVPQNCNLRIETTNGTIEVAGVTGTLILETTNGKVTAREIGGEVQVKTTNGSISADLNSIRPGKELDFYTTNGSIKVFLPGDSAFEVRGKTTNGSIRSDFPVMVRGKYGTRRLEGVVNGGGTRLFLDTTNGSIAVLAR